MVEHLSVFEKKASTCEGVKFFRVSKIVVYAIFFRWAFGACGMRHRGNDVRHGGDELPNEAAFSRS